LMADAAVDGDEHIIVANHGVEQIPVGQAAQPISTSAVTLTPSSKAPSRRGMQLSSNTRIA
jgi:hypothetical protein